MATNMLGASIVMILGGKPRHSKYTHYYLWSEMIIEDIQCVKKENYYLVQGIENCINNPIDLTDFEGFSEYKMKCGNFAYGLQSMESNTYFKEKLYPIVKENKEIKTQNKIEWLNKFVNDFDFTYTKKT